MRLPILIVGLIQVLRIILRRIVLLKPETLTPIIGLILLALIPVFLKRKAAPTPEQS